MSKASQGRSSDGQYTEAETVRRLDRALKRSFQGDDPELDELTKPAIPVSQVYNSPCGEVEICDPHDMQEQISGGGKLRNADGGSERDECRAASVSPAITLK